MSLLFVTLSTKTKNLMYNNFTNYFRWRQKYWYKKPITS